MNPVLHLAETRGLSERFHFLDPFGRLGMEQLPTNGTASSLGLRVYG